jgi:hypothetical protein
MTVKELLRVNTPSVTAVVNKLAVPPKVSPGVQVITPLVLMTALVGALLLWIGEIRRRQ